MTEATFAQTFLTTLDSRPIKLPADHVEDSRRFPSRAPYILPRMPNPMSKPKSLLPGQERSITVHLKSLRNPPLDIKLTSQPLTTSVHDIKTQVSAQTRIPVDKMKVLYNKRPVQDSKTLKDVLVGGGSAEAGGNDSLSKGKIELSVMVMGGAAAIPSSSSSEGQQDQQLTKEGKHAVDTDAFWTDLRGFLMQRLKDEAEADEMTRVFKSGWESHRATP